MGRALRLPIPSLHARPWSVSPCQIRARPVADSARLFRLALHLHLHLHTDRHTNSVLKPL